MSDGTTKTMNRLMRGNKSRGRDAITANTPPFTEEAGALSKPRISRRRFGPCSPQDCEVCGSEQPFHLRLTYLYERLFVVFGNARNRSYLLVCDTCGTASRIPARTALKLAGLARDPIPFLHRYGCLLLLVVVLVVALVSWMVESSNK
jgi:hypothetical protein